MRRKQVPPDGSCLFYAIDYLRTGEERAGCASELRSLCAENILSNPETYNDVRLGMDPSSYVEWLSKESNYGGETEITILSSIYSTQISVVSLESCSILTYGEEGVGGRIYIVYNGQHFDALELTNGERIFKASFDEIDEAALVLARMEKKKRDEELRTRVRKKLRCGGCGIILENPGAFQTHCEEVEHGEDFAYDCEEIMVSEMVGHAEDD